MRQSKNHPFIHLIVSKPCIEYWFLHLCGIEHREAFSEKGAMIGKPVTTVEYLTNGRIRETVVTHYEAVNPTDLCVRAATQAIGFSPKKMMFPEKLFEGSRLGDAFLTDFPVREKQDGAECWTLIPVLLLRLLLLKYDPAAAVLALRTGKRPDRVTGEESGLARALLEMVKDGAQSDTAQPAQPAHPTDSAPAVPAFPVFPVFPPDAANFPETAGAGIEASRPMTDAGPHFVVGRPVPVRKWKAGKPKAS